MKDIIFKAAMKSYKQKLKAGYLESVAQWAARSYVFSETYTKEFSPNLSDSEARKVSDKLCDEFMKTNFNVKPKKKTKAEIEQSKINIEILDKDLTPELQFYVNNMVNNF